MTPASTDDVRDPTTWSVEDLLAAKHRGGHHVTVVIPARDEESTVGSVVEVVRRAWVDEVPLVDELVVIDSDSVDATAERARSAGAIVHRACDIRPDLGPAQGKGEALWKALHVTTGDVLAFLDADLIEWGPHFVPALLGPLLLEPGIQLVKAVYHRPLLDATGREAETGGRVTELVARPLLALNAPELAHIIQPLSGEWAIRRSAFARMFVPVGYGVEIAALLDTTSAHGPEAIAQVDLGRRAHRHHRHDTLGPMAVQVMAAVERRLGERSAADAGVVALQQFDPVEGGFAARWRQVDVAERPPAISLDPLAEVDPRRQDDS
ncbi:MAG TPA: glucosyl-3-phosphoglycerate synthase [Phycicoccus elongatus]|uniref:glucosyl-3-phosphoglycerate synthase n=1 Tax=Phycicoccus TaxID=367298 RepID=UPI001DAB99FC|nr:MULTISPECIES: glucosyl-3-phosphoglycerate synthase [Phycicoccus]MBK8728909.1 glucosyl-3-phosphoglycerate synthase [Tetrasphaera sp.]MCB1239796.1 glucosyl-3-phosphoglycerate synthase [Tetrasphaera sp.]MCB9406999.1 glucosyl-3-phosphoglycerate synthase [Tetrasphaera sp.]MCO5302977.1 glucosyl-3-phosphoglycerate synthase [Phycicoccus sp.]HPK13641.1 glucosyl-3-phosphoglycerate synthase [Phycicoccus elongatus]